MKYAIEVLEQRIERLQNHKDDFKAWGKEQSWNEKIAELEKAIKILREVGK